MTTWRFRGVNRDVSRSIGAFRSDHSTPQHGRRSTAIFGTWHAKFKGKTFLTIKLEKQQGKLTGTASHAEIQLDKDGELTNAEEQDGNDPIEEAKLTSGIPRITTKEQDSEETVQCEMKLVGTDQAEFRFITPPDITPKPWKLERAKNRQ